MERAPDQSHMVEASGQICSFVRRGFNKAGPSPPEEENNADEVGSVQTADSK